MSDCSTEAMKPKDRRTCGNCDKFVRAKGCEHLGICSEIYFEDEYGDDAFAAVRDTRQCDNPSLFKPRTDTLDQRYQQLEQVAKSMCRWFDDFLKDWGDDWELGPDAKADVMHDRKVYRKQLESLGVSLDD